VHELSIVLSVVDAVAASLSGRKVQRVVEVRLTVGALSGVVEDALQFSYGLATEKTPLEGSTLVVKHVPVRIYCDDCQLESELSGVQSFRCPQCQTPSMDVRAGRELDIESIVLEEEGP
jgi:hydrogenase nickel incorporation protein HypA/HybF